jgi:hypothetical protein
MPPRPQRPRWEVAASIVLLVVTGLGWGLGAAMEFMLLAFTDYCPPERCDADQASAFVMLSVCAALAVTVVGSLVTGYCLYRRRSALPFAIATLVLAVVAELLGAVGYFAAVGY